MIWRLKLWFAGAAVIVAALAASWFGGRTAGKTAAKDKQIAARLAATQEARDVEDEVEALDIATLKSRSQRWVRGSPKR